MLRSPQEGENSNRECELKCSVTIENLHVNGTVTKKIVHKTVFLTLGRNEFRDILLKIENENINTKYCLKDIVVHHKFWREGKATIRLKQQNLNLLLSNCPPNNLACFLKILNIKNEHQKAQPVISQRNRLLALNPRSFEKISPLAQKDINTVLQNKTNTITNETAKSTKNIVLGKPMKRKLSEVLDQENRQLVNPSKIRNTSVLKPVTLTKEQKHVLDTVMSGTSIFFTGSAGTGKSFLLRRIIGTLPPDSTFVTASTGIAACQIGGMTLHSFAGIGSGSAAIQQCIELAKRKNVTAQWRKCKHLIVDEVSMVDGDFFDKMEKVARVVRQNDKPFGGIQIILCGDFLQLPPVSKGENSSKLCFQGRAWRKCVQLILELKEVHRQSDPEFISILNHVRYGRCNDVIESRLTATENNNVERGGIVATRLCTHNEDVNVMNEARLEDLPGATKTYRATDSDPALAHLMDNATPVSSTLTLKVGAQVMLTKNMDVSQGLVNGARGVVVRFETGEHGYPVIAMVSGKRITVKQEKWTIKHGGTVLQRKQLPLKLAWAISIHKSQGMTLDCVEISLSRVFEYGQAYVALSRAKSLGGMRIVDMSRRSIRANPEVLEFYKELKIMMNENSSIRE